MTSFEAGFVGHARECGMSDQQALHILKRAADYGGVQELMEAQAQDDEDQSPGDLDVLKSLLQNEFLHDRMYAVKKRIET